MKLTFIFVIVLAISPFNFCYGNAMNGSVKPISTSQVDRFKTAIEDFIKYNQNGENWIYVDKFLRATKQVVSGMKYNIEFTAVRTNCSKDDPTNTKENCKAKDYQNCFVSIYEKSWKNFVQFRSVECMGIKIEF